MILVDIGLELVAVRYLRFGNGGRSFLVEHVIRLEAEFFKNGGKKLRFYRKRKFDTK